MQKMGTEMGAKIGDIGRAACSLYPSGRVVIDRAPMAARAEKGPIEAGTEFVVVGGDRFKLIVRPLDPSLQVTTLPGYGNAILNGKEEAAVHAEFLQISRRQEQDEHRQFVRRLMWNSASFGFVIGLGLIAIQSRFKGFASDLLWLPVLSTICWFCVLSPAAILGVATENLLLFLSIPCAFAGLVIGTIWSGPLAGVVVCFAVGVTVTIVCVVIEAIRDPIT